MTEIYWKGILTNGQCHSTSSILSQLQALFHFPRRVFRLASFCWRRRRFRGFGMDRSQTVRVEAERISLLLRQLPIILGANIFNAALVALVLWPVVPSRGILFWAVAIILVAVLRGLLWMRRRPPRTPDEVRHLTRLMVAGSAISGILWGVGLVLLFPDSLLHQVFLAFVIGGMAAR